MLSTDTEDAVHVVAGPIDVREEDGSPWSLLIVAVGLVLLAMGVVGRRQTAPVRKAEEHADSEAHVLRCADSTRWG